MRVITGSAHGVRLLTPAVLQTRPTTDRVKESLFNIIQFDIPGREVLDLFAGSGQLGIEALSRGATSAVFVDAGKEAVEVVRKNLRAAKLEQQARIVQSDAFDYVRRCGRKFDLIFLDPPYAGSILENSIQLISEIDILSDGGIIICERPLEKTSLPEVPGLTRSRDYKYGKTYLTLYRK